MNLIIHHWFREAIVSQWSSINSVVANTKKSWWRFWVPASVPKPIPPLLDAELYIGLLNLGTGIDETPTDPSRSVVDRSQVLAKLPVKKAMLKEYPSSVYLEYTNGHQFTGITGRHDTIAILMQNLKPPLSKHEAVHPIPPFRVLASAGRLPGMLEPSTSLVIEKHVEGYSNRKFALSLEF